MNPLYGEIVLEVGKTYVDKRGIEWTVRAFMFDEGRWFTEHPNGNYVALRREGAKKERWVKAKTFIASLPKSSEEVA